MDRVHGVRSVIYTIISIFEVQRVNMGSLVHGCDQRYGMHMRPRPRASTLKARTAEVEQSGCLP